MQKPYSELYLLHQTILAFAESHNNNLLWLLWHSNLRVKNVPYLCFHKVLLVRSLQSGKSWHECAQPTEKAPTQTRQLYVKFMCMSC